MSGCCFYSQGGQEGYAQDFHPGGQGSTLAQGHLPIKSPSVPYMTTSYKAYLEKTLIIYVACVHSINNSHWSLNFWVSFMNVQVNDVKLFFRVRGGQVGYAPDFHSGSPCLTLAQGNLPKKSPCVSSICIKQTVLHTRISALRFKLQYYITFDYATFYPCLIPKRSWSALLFHAWLWPPTSLGADFILKLTWLILLVLNRVCWVSQAAQWWPFLICEAFLLTISLLSLSIDQYFLYFEMSCKTLVPWVWSFQIYLWQSGV